MRTTLTERLLRALLAKRKQGKSIRDKTLTGFEARPGKQGITFSAVARLRGSGIRQPIRINVGRYPLMGLAEARDRARLLLRDLHDGIDPRTRKAEQLRAEAEEQGRRFDIVAEQYIRQRLAGARTARAIEQLIRRDLVSVWGKRPIAAITRPEVSSLIVAIAERGHRETARHVLGWAKRLFRWAVARGLLEHPPAEHLHARDLLGAQTMRQRLLSEHELRLIWRAAGETPYPDGPYVQLLLLLGVRRSELGQATWNEFDLEQALWTISAARMKANEGHTVPQPPRALTIMRSLPRLGAYVFTRGSRPLNHYAAMKRSLDLRVTALNGGKPIAHWTFHDGRRVFRTALSTLGVAPHIAELCLAHKQPGLARTYDLHRFDKEKRDALNAWETRLLSIVEPPPPNVVPLRVA
jgi:integrase